MATQDPFLFAVYHKDDYPADTSGGKMQAPRKGNGMDFDADQPWRMYHGDRFPGFPQHPHRGFETITATIDGIIDHSDSMGGAGRYGQGDLQFMTAGKGIVHGENFPLLHEDRDNFCRFFQIWLNLPRKSKMVEPNQRMHWAENIPKIRKDDGVEITVWVGKLETVTALDPTPDSWAADPSHDVGVFFITLPRGTSYNLEAAKAGTNRSLYFIKGTPVVNGQQLEKNTYAETLQETPIEIVNHSDDLMEVLVLQGQPIGEPVEQRGPFVMNSLDEIYQAHADYRRTQFGGWPWPEDAVIFPKDQGRFVKHSSGKVENAPHPFLK
ncbi:hypothetical protein HDV03_003644 [Kappamyces sp. JEL0829]|nr:hypothetical protein HDV03_003644 [Kappamyces sp. JEL0829]